MSTIDLSFLRIDFSFKPLAVGGLAMEYYGLRKKGLDMDFIIADEDYQQLACKYPEEKVDRWGDLYISLNQCELLRSIFLYDYDFFSAGAIEYEAYKMISIEKLFFMKVLAYENEPEVEKHVHDFKLIWDYCMKTFQNKKYAENAKKHEDIYIAVPYGKVFGGKYTLE